MSCIEWEGAKHNGYGIKYKRVKGKVKKVKAHRYVWEQANGPIPDGMMILHHCDNRPCVNLDHLYLGTAQDNGRDYSTRYKPRKYRYYPPEVVEEVRNMSGMEAHRKFGMSWQHARRIQRNQSRIKG